ncbi:MAG: bifunctional folylpolyglutamate synthase/dihydrofolate synthase [Planctomycetota bacterium]|jgi:dihydrofolate synthase/folylpolyglutamate synthase
MTETVSTRLDAISFLYSRIDYERTSASLSATDFKLDRMRNLLARLGDPHLVTPVVHIAGTKGKGSTAGMISSCLQAAGYSVGKFTSPHIDCFEERIQIDGSNLPESLFVTLTERLREVTIQIDAETNGLNPTFFELTTALAWLAFASLKVDLAVVEVGLGGRLDSTNLCQPIVTVITTISRDHTHILGSRIAEIAREKAGILKPGVPVVSGVTAPSAISVIEQFAAALFCNLKRIHQEFGFEASAETERLTFWTLDCRLESDSLSDWPRHQLHNGATAFAVIQTLNACNWPVSKEAIHEGLRSFSSGCRQQIIMTQPTVLVDAAHNWASVGALVETIAEYDADHKILIFGTSSDKDHAGLMRKLLPHFQTVVVTEYHSSPRATAADTLAEHAFWIGTQPLHVRRSPEEAFELACKLGSDDSLICVAGSFFLAAEIRTCIRSSAF